jgi:hypothetical protein
MIPNMQGTIISGMMGLPRSGFEALVDERPVEEIQKDIIEKEKKIKKIHDSVIFPL